MLTILHIKFLDKILAERVCVCVCAPYSVTTGFAAEMKAASTLKPSQTTHRIHRPQKESHVIASAAREKVFDKIQHQFIMKGLCK